MEKATSPVFVVHEVSGLHEVPEGHRGHAQGGAHGLQSGQRQGAAHRGEDEAADQEERRQDARYHRQGQDQTRGLWRRRGQPKSGA